MLVDYLNEAHASENLPTKKFTEQGVKHYLEWYARLGLGEQILECVKEKASANSKQNYNRGYVREVRRWSAKPFTRVQIPLPSPIIGVKNEI